MPPAESRLGLNVGTDIPMAHAIGCEIIHAGLANEAFIERATSGFEEYRKLVEPWTLSLAKKVTGVPARAIRELAHAYAHAEPAQLCWTLGITEHHNGTDNVGALITLSLLTGHVGRYGSGLQPLRGQHNNDLYVRDYGKCSLCHKCVDACGDQWQNTFASSVAGRGFDARIAVAHDAPLTDSACVYCGNRIEVCPTGALSFKSEFDMRAAVPGTSRCRRRRPRCARTAEWTAISPCTCRTMRSSRSPRRTTTR